MFKITVIATGKLKEKFYLQAVEEYQKRLSATCEFSLFELPEERLPEAPSPAQIQAALKKEAEAVKAKIPKGSYLVVCTPEGKLLSSEDLADKLKDVKNMGKSSLCVLIGSSFGLDAELKQQADFKLSFSKMTFPHHLFRVMLLEQLYRAESIQAGSRYHK